MKEKFVVLTDEQLLDITGGVGAPTDRDTIAPGLGYEGGLPGTI